MNLEDIFGLYEDVKDDLKFFTGSDVRVKILLSLNKGSKNLTCLRKEIHLSSSTILHGMYQLEKKDFIFRESGKYYLSQTGEISTNKLIDVIRAIHAINKCKNLFLNHEIGFIPSELLKDIGCLDNAKIIRSTYTDVTKPYTVLSKFLSETKNVKHLSSVFFTFNIKLLFENLEKKGQIHLLFTEIIMKKLLETVNPEIIEKGTSLNNLKLGIINENTQISLTLGDNFMALGLFSTDGTYDLNTFLISESKAAIIWGERLFNYHLKFATEFNLNYLSKNYLNKHGK